MSLVITSRTIDGVTVVHCAGRLTLGEESAALRQQVKDLISTSRQIVLDLGQVTYIDSSGLGTLVALYTSARSAGGNIKLASLNSRSRELLQVTRLYTVFETYDSAEEAARSFSAPAARSGAAGRLL